MNVTTVAVTFGIIFVAELPDKTMIAVIILASRHRPLPVFVGAATAMVVNSAVAVGAGRLIELLPHRAVESAVAALFTAGSLYLLLTREASAAREGEARAAKVMSDRHVALAALGVIIVAELGDLTQILTANLAAHYHQPWSVFLGSVVALIAVMAIGVIGGRALLRVLPLGVIRKIAGTLLAGFAAYSIVQAARG
ncbi:MAG TPA: TMEM165/GDT1 family protein [Acidimicrobiales bacterium]|nr:TMEM165/GDT1 family protein [Acidimicrobiales bacterium]